MDELLDYLNAQISLYEMYARGDTCALVIPSHEEQIERHTRFAAALLIEPELIALWEAVEKARAAYFQDNPRGVADAMYEALSPIDALNARSAEIYPPDRQEAHKEVRK